MGKDSDIRLRDSYKLPTNWDDRRNTGMVGKPYEARYPGFLFRHTHLI